MNDEWAEILDDYNHAKAVLWGVEGTQYWHRDDEAGMYYMWSAYHKAMKAAEPKDQLLLARILAMVADECGLPPFDSQRYEKYIKPSVEAYERAIQTGQQPTKKELDKIRTIERMAAYDLTLWSAPYDEHVKWIQGHERLKECGFEFYDSSPIWFEHDRCTARLKLDSGKAIATFRFDNVVELLVAGDPFHNFVEEFCCGPSHPKSQYLTFNVECYQITCTSISVESIEKGTHP